MMLSRLVKFHILGASLGELAHHSAYADDETEGVIGLPQNALRDFCGSPFLKNTSASKTTLLRSRTQFALCLGLTVK